jgi:hypothetical protein
MIAVIVASIAPPAAAQRASQEAIAKFSLSAPPTPKINLKVWDGLQRVDKIRLYVPGPVFVDWNRLNLEWWFLGSASVPGIGPVRWEISQYPFPAGPFTPIPGFGLVGEAPSLEFSVDLESLAPRPPGWTPKLAFKGPVGVLTQGAKVPSIPTETTSPKKKIIPTSPRFPGSPIPGFASAPIQAYVKTSAPVIAQSMSLHVRVVPLDVPGGAPIGPPSNTVVLDFGDPDPTGTIQVKFVHPNVALAGYVPMRPYDFNHRCYAILGQDMPVGFGGVIPKGTPLDLCRDDSDLLSDIVDAVGDFFGFMVDFVNWVSSAYDTIKSTVASTVSGALTGLGIPCNAECVGAGINIALAATGMPPDIPDFEQLKAMGEGYVADTLADYAASQTGIPVPDVAKDAIKQQVHDMIEGGAESLKSGGPGAPQYIPDLRYQFHGPIVVMDLTNPDPTFWSMTTTLTLEDATGRYETATFSAPAIKPGGTTRIALTLVPKQDPKGWMNLLPTEDDIPFGPWVDKTLAAEDALDAWRATYRGSPLVLKATVGVYEGFTKTCDAVSPSCS